MRLLIRWAVMGVALYAAQYLIDGIRVEQNALLVYAGMAVVLAVVNALVRPVLLLLTCPVQLLTLGLFTFVVNAVAFWLASWLAQQLGIGFVVDGFVAALLGSLLVSIVSTVMNGLLFDKRG